MPRFTDDTLISEVLAAIPQTAEVFERHGLGCPSCLAAGMESISAVTAMHEVSPEQLLEELNEYARLFAREEL